MFSYESLEVYKKAYLTNQKVYRLIKERRTIPAYAKNQLGRASLSIMLNIAEGCSKFSSKDKRNFYVTARGSAFECSALIQFLSDENEIDSETRDELFASYDEISKNLFVLIKRLGNLSA